MASCRRAANAGQFDPLDIVANVYTPANYDPQQTFPAVVIAHPNGGFATGYAQARLRQASDARAQEMAGGRILYAGDADTTDAQIAALPFEMYRQGYEYYWRTLRTPTRPSNTP